MSDQAESSSSRRAVPMTPPPPPPPSPASPEDSSSSSEAITSSEAILWPASDDDSSSTPHTNLLSLHWLSDWTPPPEPEAEPEPEEEPLEDVPTLLNFDLEDLVDWNTTSTGTVAVTEAPTVTQLLWVHNPAAGEMDDLSRLAFGIQSPQASILPVISGIQFPEASILPVTPGIQFPEASISPLALGIHPSPVYCEIPESFIDPMPSPALGILPAPASSEIEAPWPPQGSLSALALGLRPQVPASFEIQPPQAPIPRLARGTESSMILPLTLGIEFPEGSISPEISPLALGIQQSDHDQTSLRIQAAEVPFSSLPPNPCSFSEPQRLSLRNLPSVPCTLPLAPPLWDVIPPSPYPSVPERRNLSVFPRPPVPPAGRQLLLLQHSASASVSSAFSHQFRHLARHLASTSNAGFRQQTPAVAHAPVTTFSTTNASANFLYAGHVPASRPSWQQAIAPRRSWTPDQQWISSGQDDMELPIPRRPQFSPAAAAVTMAPLQPPLVVSYGNYAVNRPRGDVSVGDQQRLQTAESSRPRKRSKTGVRT